MTVSDRLAQLASALPEGGSVTFTKADLLALVAESGGQPPPDLTVDQVAAFVQLDASAIRRRLRSGELRGYLLPGGREWRVPPAALETFRRSTRPTARQTRLKAWRRVGTARVDP